MEQEEKMIGAAREYLSGYRVCVDMLNLGRYERRRKKPFGEECHSEDIMQGNEALWQARMLEIEHLLASLRNGREKMVLYYHYIKGESVERSADLLGFSRRTGYRVHRRGLLLAGTALLREHPHTFEKMIELIVE